MLSGIVTGWGVAWIDSRSRAPKISLGTQWVLSCLNRLEVGVRCRLLMQFLLYLTYNKVVHVVHVYFVDILLPHFLMDILINSLIFKVGHLHVRFGMIDTLVRDG